MYNTLKEFTMNAREIILLVLLVLSFVLIIYTYHQERKFAKTYLCLADLYKDQVDYLIKLTENQMLANVDFFFRNLYHLKIDTKEGVEKYFAYKQIYDPKLKFRILYESAEFNDEVITDIEAKTDNDEERYELMLQRYLKTAQEHNNR